MFKSLKKSFYKQNLITQYYDLKQVIIDPNDMINVVIESDIALRAQSAGESRFPIDKVYGYNEKTDNWHCLDCGENMGNNPRQLCGKSYCLNV